MQIFYLQLSFQQSLVLNVLSSYESPPTAYCQKGPSQAGEKVQKVKLSSLLQLPFSVTESHNIMVFSAIGFHSLVLLGNLQHPLIACLVLTASDNLPDQQLLEWSFTSGTGIFVS